MKKKLSLVFAATMLAVSVAACGGNSTTKTEESKPEAKTEQKAEENTTATEVDPAFAVEISDELKEKAKKFSVGMVTDTGGIDDKSFNQGTWEGIQQFAKLTGATVNYKQSNAEADYVPNVSSFADDESDLIVAAGFLFEDSIKQVADANPDSKFLIIDRFQL